MEVSKSIKMHRRATMFAALGDKEAAEWLQGYNDRIIGLTSDDYSMQGIRGWLYRDNEEEGIKIEAELKNYQNRTDFIFSDSPLHRV